MANEYYLCMLLQRVKLPSYYKLAESQSNLNVGSSIFVGYQDGAVQSLCNGSYVDISDMPCHTNNRFLAQRCSRTVQPATAVFPDTPPDTLTLEVH